MGREELIEALDIGEIEGDVILEVFVGSILAGQGYREALQWVLGEIE